MKRPLVFLAVVGCTLLFGLAFASGLAGAEEITGERSFNTTTPDAGDTVEVTVTTTIDEEMELELVDDPEPPFESATFDGVSVDGEEVTPLLQVVEEDGVVIVLDAVGPGEVEFAYSVTIPEDAEQGTTYELEGLLGSEGDSFPVGGETTVTVGDEEVTPAMFGVSIESVPESVTAGEAIDVEYAVENEGGESGTQDIVFSVDGEQMDTEPVELVDGDSFDGVFTHEVGDDAPAELEVSIASEDDEASAIVSVDADENGDDTGVTDDSDDTGVDDGDDPDDDGFGPGFSVLTALLAGILGLALLAVRRW